jgi:hypothetical protein
LLAELKDTIAKAFEIDAASLGNSLPGLLNLATEKSGEIPFILIFDISKDGWNVKPNSSLIAVRRLRV